MAFSTFGEAVEEVCSEWNKAEKAIKSAEHVEGQVVNPSIYELRYAGRRIIEALTIQESDPEKALRLLSDAHFFAVVHGTMQ